MPPKMIVTKEQVLQAAVELTRSKSASAVTARRVAAKLGSSA